MKQSTQKTLFLLLFSLVFYSLGVPVSYGGTSIDSSWHESLVMAIEKNEIFGSDFIFNYGPLGYFNTRILPKGISPWLMFFLDTFMLLNFLIIIKLALEKARDNWKIAAVISLLILTPWGFIADCSFTLFYFFLFWLFYSQRQKNAVTLLLAVLLSVIIFYVKVNLSIVVYGILYISLIYFWWSKIITLRTAVITAALQIALTWSLSFLLNVEILPYLQMSLKIIDAYQDAMAEMILTKQEFLSLFLFEILILVVILGYIFKNFKQFLHHQNLYFLGVISLTWFLCFKQVHTAIGYYNVFGYFLFMPPLAALIYLFANFKTLPFGKIFITIFILSLVATQLLRFYMSGHTLKNYFLSYPPTEVTQKLAKSFTISELIKTLVVKNPIVYFKTIVDYDYEKNFTDEENNRQKHLPEDILKEIGNSSIDIVPTDISYIFFNRLNYVHRPIIQTYQANSAWLAEKNGEKYLSKTSPDFVLFQVSSFREQNPFWEDGNVNLALLKRYNLVDSAFVKNSINQKDTLLLFKKNAIEKTLKLQQITKKTYQLNKEIAIDSTEAAKNLRYFDADIQYSLLGKLARFMFQPPYLYCNVTYKNGKQRTFRVINTILKGGVLVNRSVTTQAEAAKFFLTQGQANEKITKIRFWAKYPWGFKPDFEGSFKEITIN